MRKTNVQSEKCFRWGKYYVDRILSQKDIKDTNESLAISAIHFAYSINSKMILVFVKTG